uniref:NADH-ubiquinone oxidoreductase chain 2 n=1 Tax=Sphaerius sp. BT0074 TaxID=546487 RepID=B6D8U4_9COLE|nr:NADH dehydrogenase subunit 2 [Sphaerius sp. BT0074]ACF35082.1 NADH dehydrogenase subunit 2 [Sphaerius sp. BT0074]
MNNFYKWIFMSTLIMGTLISISSYSWLSSWMGLEINLLSFIPLINNSNNKLFTETSMKYFLIQTIASTIFLFSIILSMLMNNLSSEIFSINKMSIILINSSLLLKMGSAPFHFWFPEVMNNLNWNNCIILLTWQKIAPMLLLSYTIQSFLYIIIIMSVIIGSIGGLNQINLKKIIAYSSINHIGWMISSLMISETMWMIYFLIYSIISISMMMFLNKLNINYIKQMYMMMNQHIYIKFFFILNLFSLGGLPPFLGFFSKWIVIQYFLNMKMYMILFLMLMTTLITLFYYIRLTFSSILLNYQENNWNILMKKNMLNKFFIFMMMFISINSLILCTMIFNFY